MQRGTSMTSSHLAKLMLEEKEEIKAQALKAAMEVGAHAYKLDGLKPREKLCYIEIGCGGDGGPEQEEVAKLIDKKIKEFKAAGIKVHFLILLGDNIYPSGASSPFDEKFRTLIEEKYNMLIFACPGNHDADITIERVSPIMPGYYIKKKPSDIIINEVAYCYTPEGEKFPTPESKRNFYEKEPEHWAEDEGLGSFIEVNSEKNYEVRHKSLNINGVWPKFNMPNTFFSIYTETEEIFFLDSNMLGKDFLNWHESLTNKNNLSPNNQIPFIIEELKIAKTKGRSVCAKMHQLPKTTGERSLPNNSDIKNYFYDDFDKINQLKKSLEADTDSYNELIGLIFKNISNHIKLKYKIDVEIDDIDGAHDHYMELYDNKKYFQVVSGGGGSNAMQQLVSHQLHPEIKFSLSQHGFVLRCGDTVRIFTTKGLNLVYDKSKHEFLHDDKNARIKMLRHTILKACDTHINALKEAQCKRKENNETDAENKGMISHAYSYFTFYYKKYEHVTRKLTRQALKMAGRNSKTHLENEIACIYGIMAYFNQKKLDMEQIFTYLAEWKQTYGTQAFYLILKNQLREQLSRENFSDVLDIFTVKNKTSNYSDETNSENEATAGSNIGNYY